MCYNHNYFYTKKIIILIRKFWRIASNIALLSASRRNKRKIQNSVILMSPCLRRLCLYVNQLHAVILNVCVTVTFPWFGRSSLPSPFSFSQMFPWNTKQRNAFFFCFCALCLFVSLCLIYCRELRPERKWEEKVGEGGFGSALRSHHFSGGK